MFKPEQTLIISFLGFKMDDLDCNLNNTLPLSQNNQKLEVLQGITKKNNSVFKEAQILASREYLKEKDESFKN